MALEFISSREARAGFLAEATTFLDTQCSTHPFQYPEWTRSRSPDNNCFAFCREDEKIRLFARCSAIRPLGRMFPWLKSLVIPRGPVSDDLHLLLGSLAGLLSWAREKGCTYVEISPDCVNGPGERLADALSRAGWIRVEAPRASLRLDLRPSADAIIESFRKTTRYEVRRAERHEVLVSRAARESDLSNFLQVYQSLARRKDFSPEKPAEMLHVMRRLLTEPKRGALLLASHERVICGGIVIVRGGSRCWYVWGATKTERDAPVSVGHILQWHGILWAKQNQCLEYDFGGYTEGATSGPALFKHGFCDDVVHFPGNWRYVLNPVEYRFCERIWKARSKIFSIAW